MSPARAGRPCAHPGCTVIVHTGSRCAEHARAYDLARGTSVQRGYGTEWRKISQTYLAAHPWCKCGQRARHTDHIVPRRAGGTDEESNLQGLCHSCHSRKTASQDSMFAHRGGV
jgi:5-methylcytosine-specific restriction enzyme A